MVNASIQINFVVPGFSKCATTTLCELLDSHPDIYLPPAKEPGFFSYDFHHGIDWYRLWFNTLGHQRLIGDGSTSYSSDEYAEVSCRRLLEHNPNCKFIFIARNPIERLESSFREMHTNGYKYAVVPSMDLGETLCQLPSMVADTCYWKLINIYRHHVDATQMHVVFTEDLKRAPEICLRSCFDFLGADTRVHLSEVSRQRNSRDEKYMDGQLLHWIRTTPSVARWWNCLSVRKQTWLMRILRLRSKMNGPIHWSEAAKEIFREQLLDDARLFLSHYGKPESFWDFSSIIDNEPAFKVAS